MIPLVDLKAQYATISAEVDVAIRRVVESAAFILGPDVEAFENEFAAFCQARHCVGVASGTDAIHLALRALDVGPGDEVILPAFTFVATALGVTLAGARPVLVDVRRDDALLDAGAIEAAITPRTKAVIAVHLYGQCADMAAIAAVTRRHGLRLVEDAAQAHGATYRGGVAGSLGDIGCFSFYPGKNLGAYGDGGAITTNDDTVAERLRLLRNWGSRRKYYHEEPGLNSRLDTLQAAILRVKLARLPAWNERRRLLAKRFAERLAGRHDLRLVECHEDRQSVFHLLVARAPARDALMARLREAGIQAGIHYPFAVHQLGAYQDVARVAGSLAESEAWARECVSLPMYAELSDEQVDQITNAIGD